jgi:hypothetical protein
MPKDGAPLAASSWNIHRRAGFLPGNAVQSSGGNCGVPSHGSAGCTVAIQEGPSSFAIFDTFDDEAGRDAHLNGKVAAALMEKAKAGDLFAKAPDIHKLEILAAKRPR